MTSPRTKTARDFFYCAHRRVHDAMHTFVFEIAPTLTREEFDKLVAKRPEVYSKYREFIYRKEDARDSNTLEDI
jgi:hypothetical protein